jgi:hypothetical protein
MKKLLTVFVILFLAAFNASSQENDTIPVQLFPIDSVSVQAYHPDSSLRIINLNPFFTLHVDSTLTYQLQINKNPDQYFWYLKNSPVGLRINKDNGQLSFNANRSLFLSGKLKYDINYKVNLGVQNLNDPQEKVDTSFNIIFYNTEIISSKVKPTVQGNIWVDEGETVSFRVLCEAGSFPIDHILTLTSTPISKYNDVQKCGDEFSWTPGYDLVKDSDSGKVKIIQLYFVGTNSFNAKDTATVRLIVREALNYPLAREEHLQVVKNIERYITQLKFTFLQLDKKLKKTKNIRTTFDLTSASTSLTGTVLATSSSSESQRTGKILPSVGLALVPIKEASAPNRMVDQNQASLIRASIKRMEYILRDNQLLGEKDPDIAKKTNKLKEELKQVQMQLIDVPIEITNEFTEEELTRYFNSPKVNKKYRLKKL